MTVPLEKGSFDVTFRVDDKDAPVTMATRLCSSNAELLGVNQENLNSCVAPVATYLNNAASQFLAQRTLTFPLKLNGVSTTVNFRTDMDTPAKYAYLMCRDNAAAFNISNETYNDCLRGVNDYVTQVLQKYVADRQIPVSLKIGELNFDLKVIPSQEGIINVSQRLCTEHKAALNIDDSSIPRCVEQVGNAVLKNIQERVAAARAQKAAAATAGP